MATSAPRLISLDIGNGFVEYVSSTQKGSFPSVIAVSDKSVDGFSGMSESNDFLIEYNGKQWAIGHTVYTSGLMPVSITHRSRVETEYYRVLFAAALAVSAQQTTEIKVIVSLPPAAYWDKEKQKDILAGEYVVKYAGRNITYTLPRENIFVIPEGFGTAALFCLDEHGILGNSDIFNQEVGVVDVGTYTTDFVHLSSMKLVKNSTDSIPHALHDIHERIKTYAASQGVDIDPYRLDDVLRQGYFLKGGRQINILPQIDEYRDQLSKTISGRLRSLWNGGDNVQIIIITGGGADYIADLLSLEFEHVRIVTDIERRIGSWECNAEGAYRYLLFVEGMKANAKK